jgi:hypothetical protein
VTDLNLQDALFNWLQIKIVADARPEDQAARDTLDFFEQILKEDHQMSDFHIAQTDDTMYYVHYAADGKGKKQMFDKEAAEKLLTDINSNPKYNE